MYLIILIILIDLLILAIFGLQDTSSASVFIQIETFGGCSLALEQLMIVATPRL